MRLWLLIPVVFLWVVVASAQESQGRASLVLQPAAAAALPDAPLLSPQSPALGPARASLPPNAVAEHYNSMALPSISARRINPTTRRTRRSGGTI